MCKTLDSIIENPALLEEGEMPQPEALGVGLCPDTPCDGSCVDAPCEGCCFVLNWLLGYGPHKSDGTPLSASEFLLACIEKRAELEINSGLSKKS
jgi:hypothetical protein